MNVYSIRLIPNLKLKLCEFLGIASSFAIEQLVDRLQLLERKMENLDSRMKRPRKTLVFSTAAEPKLNTKPKAKVVSPKIEETLKKKMVTAKKPAKPQSIPLESILEENTPILMDDVKTRLVSLAPQAEETTPVSQVVFLIQPDDATRKAVGDYFADKMDLIEVSSTADLEEKSLNREVNAVLFDRGLLASEENRQLLKRLKDRFPEVAMVGLSNYLTLAFSETLPDANEIATYLTKPIDASGLAAIFDNQEKRAIS